MKLKHAIVCILICILRPTLSAMVLISQTAFLGTQNVPFYVLTKDVQYKVSAPMHDELVQQFSPRR